MSHGNLHPKSHLPTLTLHPSPLTPHSYELRMKRQMSQRSTRKLSFVAHHLFEGIFAKNKEKLGAEGEVKSEGESVTFSEGESGGEGGGHAQKHGKGHGHGHNEHGQGAQSREMV